MTQRNGSFGVVSRYVKLMARWRTLLTELLFKVGLAHDLKKFRANEIEKGRIQQEQKRLDKKRTQLDWGVPLDKLDVISWDDYLDQCKSGRSLVSISGMCVLNISQCIFQFFWSITG